MKDEEAAPFNPADCSRDARAMLRMRMDLPVSLLRKHDREFWRGRHAGTP